MSAFKADRPVPYARPSGRKIPQLWRTLTAVLLSEVVPRPVEV